MRTSLLFYAFFIIIQVLPISAHGNQQRDQKLAQQLKTMRAQHINFVDCVFTDLTGALKEISVSIAHFERALQQHLMFDGSSIPGYTAITESDLMLKLDTSTISTMPWSQGDIKTARVICDVYRSEEEPYPGDPRFILKQVLEEAWQMGYDFHVGPELEFFLLKDNEPTACDGQKYFDSETSVHMQQFKKIILTALQAQGINVEKIHHEVAPGQHEISIHYGNALHIADQLMLAKNTITTLAQSMNLRATFMPKPHNGVNGSGMHVHFSLYDVKNERNAFYDKDDSLHLSETAKYFLAGVLHHIRSLTALFNPTVNSYKRLIPGFEAPIYVCWGSKNRSAAIRIPLINTDEVSASRAEIRSPDPSSNPYLVFAALLKAGLEGIKNKMDLMAEMNVNLYHLTEQERTRRNIVTLPSSLAEALELLQQNDLVRSLLGDNCLQEYVTMKEQEVRAYNVTVTNWEIARYL